MHNFRMFNFTYGPLIMLGLAIIGLYLMAICIGMGINPHF